MHAPAKEIPLDLPKPDGKQGDVTKPAKLYILAGQSNMFGMGDIAGARPSCPNLFLSAPAKAGHLEILGERRSRLLF